MYEERGPGLVMLCFSTDLYIICGLLLLYTINIVWYSDSELHVLLCVQMQVNAEKCLKIVLGIINVMHMYRQSF